jgi:hypothetical protein
MFPGETILTGADPVCPDCGVGLTLQVLRSGAGYYVGTDCCGGPITRETGYFGSHNEAHAALWTLSEALNNGTTLPSFVRR